MAFTSSSGSPETRLGALKWRISGRLAAAISFSAWSTERMVHSMFDWPEQNHTSPTTTSEKVSAFAPRTSSRAGLGRGLERIKFQRPCAVCLGHGSSAGAQR